MILFHNHEIRQQLHKGKIQRRLDKEGGSQREPIHPYMIGKQEGPDEHQITFRESSL